MPAELDVVVLGCGCGSTQTYYGQASSSFVLRLDGQPVLMLDVGLGAVCAALRHVGRLPQHVYVSHNHTDHAGELPVLLAVEAQAGARKTLLAEAAVMATLQQHRLAELTSTGKPLSHFADCQPCQVGVPHQLPHGLSITPLLARHAERCCGLLVHWNGRPVLGWTADSAYDAALYRALAAAPVVLLDGRARGGSEHAGFAQLQAAACSGIFGEARCFLHGYGRGEDAPPPGSFPSLTPLQPGDVLHLGTAAAHAQAMHGHAQAAAHTVVSQAHAGGLVATAVLRDGLQAGSGDLGSSCSAALAAPGAGAAAAAAVAAATSSRSGTWANGIS